MRKSMMKDTRSSIMKFHDNLMKDKNDTPEMSDEFTDDDVTN